MLSGKRKVVKSEYDPSGTAEEEEEGEIREAAAAEEREDDGPVKKQRALEAGDYGDDVAGWVKQEEEEEEEDREDENKESKRMEGDGEEPFALVEAAADTGDRKGDGKRRRKAGSDDGDSSSDGDSSDGDDDKPRNVFATGTVFNHKDAISYKKVYKLESLERVAASGDLSEFVTVNPTQLAMAWGQCRRNPYVRSASAFILDMIIPGGVVFKLPGSADKKSVGAGGGSIATATYSDEQRRWNAAWTQLAHDVLQSLWECGFAAIGLVPDAEHEVMPCVMDVTATDVLYRSNVFNKRAFVYRRHINRSAIGSTSDLYAHAMSGRGARALSMAEMFNAVNGSRGKAGLGKAGDGAIIGDVLTIVADPPDSATGDIQSKVSTLMTEQSTLAYRRSLQIHIETLRSKPPYFTEHSPVSYKWQQDARPLPPEASVGRKPPTATDVGGGGVSDYFELMRTKGAAGARAIYDARAKAANEVRAVDGIGERVDVPFGRIVKPTPSIDPPADIDRASILHADFVSLIFGIPPGLLHSRGVTAAGSSSSSKDPRSGSSTRSAGDQEGGEILRKRVQHARHSLIDYLRDVHRFAFASRWAKRVARETPLSSSADFESVTDVEIYLPGMPSEQQVRQYYDMGVLKYDAFKRYVSITTTIPPEDLSADPDPPQVEYEPEPTPAVGGGAKKKKPATKKKKSAAAVKRKRKTQRSRGKPTTKN